MKKAIYKIFDLLQDRNIGLFCYGFLIVGLLILSIFSYWNESANDYFDFIPLIIPFIPSLFFIGWLVFALIVFSIEALIVAPIEFVVYKLGIPKIKINVDVIWKYQQRN